MTKYKGRIVTIIIVAAAIAGIAFFAATQFPQLVPSHTIPVH